MTITSKDIVILASEVMADVPEGGGAATNTLITGGASNEIFDDTTDFDSTEGTVQVRLLYGGVWTADTSRALAVRSYIPSQPSDARFTALLSEAEPFDRQVNIKNRMEQYYGKGTIATGYLFENHVKNQRSVQLFMRPNDVSPVIGETLVLVQNEDQPEQFEQYVRVADKSERERTFTDSQGKDYQAKIVTLEITAELEYDFKGSPPSEFFTAQADAVKIREASVIDANKYYSSKKLTVTANAGDTVVQVDSIFQQLIPSSQQETPLPDQRVSGDAVTLIQAGDGVTQALPAIPAQTAAHVGNPIHPNSLSIQAGSKTYTDAAGLLMDGTAPVGVVDYAAGTFTPTVNIDSGTATFKPAGAPLVTHDSIGIDITPERQAYNYVVTLTPPPEPGTLAVYYMNGGVWYTLKDDGTGRLRGADSKHGSGTVSFVTGTVSITCGAYPDAGSTLIVTSGDRANTNNRSDQTVAPPHVSFTLQEDAAQETIVISWPNHAGQTVTATVNVAGEITGAGTGRFLPKEKKIQLQPNELPLGGTTYTVQYGWGTKQDKSWASPVVGAGGLVSLDFGATNLIPGQQSFEMTVVADTSGLPENEKLVHTLQDFTAHIYDRGDGKLYLTNGIEVGTIDYAAGTAQVQSSITVQAQVQVFHNQYVGGSA